MNHPYLVSMNSDVYVHYSEIKSSLRTGTSTDDDALSSEVRLAVGGIQSAEAEVIVYGHLPWMNSPTTVSLSEFGIEPHHITSGYHHIIST